MITVSGFSKLRRKYQAEVASTANGRVTGSLFYRDPEKGINDFEKQFNVALDESGKYKSFKIGIGMSGSKITFRLPQLNMALFLFIDDERFPPDWIRSHGYIGEGWNVRRSLSAVQEFVRQNGMPTFISFDHDLGDGEPTGMDIAKWLVEQDMDGTAMFPSDFNFTVHSMNPVGKANIEGYLNAYLELITS